MDAIEESDDDDALLVPAELIEEFDLLADVPPLTIERIPPGFRKHLEPETPLHLRLFAAKGMLPLGPSELCHALAIMAGDSVEEIAVEAKKSISTLPERVISSAMRDESLSPRVLELFARELSGNEAALEFLLLNGATHDSTFAHIARNTNSVKLLEVAAGNQIRLLRSEEILRAVITNAATSKALVDVTCDFAVRNGVYLGDIAAMVASYTRIHGAPPSRRELEEQRANSAEAFIEELGEAAKSDAEVEEPERLTMSQRIGRMNVAERIKLATLGNKEARTILLRDTNKLVLVATVRSPRITEGEVLLQASAKTTVDDVLRVIYGSREWTRVYPIRLALTTNPKVPLAIAMRFLSTLREADVREVAGSRSVSPTLRVQAKKALEKKK